MGETTGKQLMDYSFDEGYDTVIEARQIDHILKRHGENGVANRTMADPTDIARIEYALENPDTITKSDPTKAYVFSKDGKNKPADTVLYETLLEDGSYYVVQAVPDTKKHTLYVLTAYIGESSIQSEAPAMSGIDNPILTSETQDTITSNKAMHSSDVVSSEDTTGASANSIPPDINNVNIGDAKKEFGTSASVADSLGLPGAKSAPNSSISVSDLMGLVKGDAEKYIPKPAGKTNEAGAEPSTPQTDMQNVSPDGGQHGRGKETLSAAKEGFTGKQGYYDLLTDENTQRDRAGDVRPVEVPKKDASGKNVSEFVGNVYGSDLTSDAMASRIEELVRDNVLGFERQSNEKSLLGARDYIFGSEETGKGKGVAATRAEITRAVERGKIGTDDIATC